MANCAMVYQQSGEISSRELCKECFDCSRWLARCKNRTALDRIIISVLLDSTVLRRRYGPEGSENRDRSLTVGQHCHQTPPDCSSEGMQARRKRKCFHITPGTGASNTPTKLRAPGSLCLRQSVAEQKLGFPKNTPGRIIRIRDGKDAKSVGRSLCRWRCAQTILN